VLDPFPSHLGPGRWEGCTSTLRPFDFARGLRQALRQTQDFQIGTCGSGFGSAGRVFNGNSYSLFVEMRGELSFFLIVERISTAVMHAASSRGGSNQGCLQSVVEAEAGAKTEAAGRIIQELLLSPSPSRTLLKNSTTTCAGIPLATGNYRSPWTGYGNSAISWSSTCAPAPSCSPGTPGLGHGSD